MQADLNNSRVSRVHLQFRLVHLKMYIISGFEPGLQAYNKITPLDSHDRAVYPHNIHY